MCKFYPLELLNVAHQRLIGPAIEAILNTYGLGGEVLVVFDEYPGGQTLSISVSRSSATELSLILGTCEQEVAFTPDCCTIPPVTPVPPIPRSEDQPEVCTPDLYHQLMRYDGLDIQQITIGSACGFMMRNLYEYDGLHRITAMNNVFFGPTPYPDAFSTTYSYDKAGNIQQLMRRGIIGMDGSTPQLDTIDLLQYTYAGSSGLSSVLASVNDDASNPAAQPFGVAAPLSTYGHDGNGNMTVGGPVSALYNIMNLPTSLATSAGTRHFAYVYGAGKYSARIEADTALTETRHYLGGLEFKDGQPESYNFGDGRIVYSDTVPPRPQFRLHDHLGNTVVFFEDINRDSCITTEADTSGLELEILQRLWYYPFGMAMEGLSTWDTEPGQWYRYNGKERDTISGWTDFGARWGVLEIGRWNGVDPMADQYYGWSPYVYVYNNPLAYIDPDGRNGVLAIDKDAGTITVTANFHFSPNSSAALAARGKANNLVSDNKFEEFIQYNWKGTHSVEVDGQLYKVIYDIKIINHDTHEEAKSAWQADPASNFLYVSEGGSIQSNYAADLQVLTLNLKQHKNGDGKTFSHEVGHALGLGHNFYTYKGKNTISKGTSGNRAVLPRDVLNTVSNAVRLANQTSANNVNVLLQTGKKTNTVTILNPNQTMGRSSTYPVPEHQKD